MKSVLFKLCWLLPTELEWNGGSRKKRKFITDTTLPIIFATHDDVY